MTLIIIIVGCGFTGFETHRPLNFISYDENQPLPDEPRWGFFLKGTQ